MPFAVVFQRSAREDARAASDWFRQRSKRAEAAWRSRLIKAIRSLETNPFRFAEAEEAATVGREVRECLVGRRRGIVHRVLFTIEGNTVLIHRIRHASQDRLTEDDF